MAYRAISDEFGWANMNSARSYDLSLEYRDIQDRFADAFLYAGMTEDRAAAVAAVAEAEGISPHTAKTRQSAKEIAAHISSLPAEQKAEVARELAQDAVIASEAAMQVAKTLNKKRRDNRRDHGLTTEHKTPLDGALTVSTLDLLAHRAKKAVDEVSEVSGEALELALDSLNSIEASVRTMRATVVGSADDWDEAAKKELTR